jgi:hypothetical protein
MPEPLFILTPNRSLAALACAMLGNHPDMIGLAETNLFVTETYAELAGLHRIDDRFQHGLLRTIAELGFGEQTEKNVEIARAWLADNEALSTTEIFRDLQALAEPRRVIDTSIVYVYRPGVIDRITRSFPDAHYLHLAMHPRVTCELAYKTRKMAAETRLGRAIKPGVQLDPDTIWYQPHTAILEGLANVSPAHRMILRGEVLLSEPAENLEKIATWLRVRVDDEMVAAMMRPEESPFSRYGPANAPLGNDPHFLENPRLVRIEEQPMDLEGPLSWDENLVFSASVKRIAKTFGY